MWFSFLLLFTPSLEQHRQCMEFEDGYAEAYNCLVMFADQNQTIFERISGWIKKLLNK
jgi:hypothetical protein